LPPSHGSSAGSLSPLPSSLDPRFHLLRDSVSAAALGQPAAPPPSPSPQLTPPAPPYTQPAAPPPSPSPQRAQPPRSTQPAGEGTRSAGALASPAPPSFPASSTTPRERGGRAPCALASPAPPSSPASSATPRERGGRSPCAPASSAVCPLLPRPDGILGPRPGASAPPHVMMATQQPAGYDPALLQALNNMSLRPLRPTVGNGSSTSARHRTCPTRP
ncbi:hypothetical protein BRADI_2g33399v3, partial [Brachypodium distachyon]